VYKESVHGQALLQESNLDVPACTDCHGKHSISDPRTALFRADSPDLCSSCHSNAQLMKKYGISTNVTTSYLNDFHGATVRLEKDRDPNITSYKAVCYDCHGIHDIKKTDDPASNVVKTNLVKTCQKCHPTADDNFPAAWTSHYQPNLQKWPLVYFVNLFYSIVIPVTICGMLAFIGLDVLHTIRKRRQSRRAK
jgi:predicted CXXCH cytochrome family protein